MRIYQWGSYPVCRRFSSVQVPYFYHTLLLFPYRVVEGDGHHIHWEKRQVMHQAPHFRCLAAARFKEECLAVKDPRESVLIPYVHREEAVYRQLDGIFNHFRRLESGVTVLLEEPFPMDIPEWVDVYLSASGYVLKEDDFDFKAAKRLTGVVYPVFPGFSDTPADWERHFAHMKKQGVETVLPFVPMFEAETVKSFFLMASQRGKDLKVMEEIFHHRPRKEYTCHIWQRILPALKAYGLKAVPKPPQQAGTLYFNRQLAVRCFFLWHWLSICGREIEAWNFHRLAFRLWRAPWDVRQIHKEGNLKVFEMDFLEDHLKGQVTIYPDEKLWL